MQRRVMNSLSLVLVSLSALSSVVTGDEYKVKRIFPLSIEDTGGESPFDLMAWLPPDYYDDPSSLHPCVIAILGSGELGDVQALLKQGPLRFISRGHDRAFRESSAIVISPALPASFDTKDPSYIDQFVDYIIAAYKVDPDRLSMVGLGFGGGVVWSYGKSYANRLSVMAPSSADTNPSLNSPEDYAIFSQTIIWAFHAGNDDYVYNVVPFHLTGNFSGTEGPAQDGWFGGIAVADSQPPSASPSTSPTSGPTSGPTLNLTRMLQSSAYVHSTRMLDSYPVPIRITEDRGIASRYEGVGLTTRTAAFSVEDGWVWIDGMNFVADKRHQMTLLNNTSLNPHWSGWMTPWGFNNKPNDQFWKWLFAQKRGEPPTSYESFYDWTSSSAMVHPSWTTTTCGVLAALFALFSF